MNANTSESTKSEVPWAHRLENLDLEGGWRVGKRVSLPDDHTGGAQSVGYEASQGNSRGFLKALDLYPASKLPPAIRLKATRDLIDSFLIECSLYETCGEKRMDRVVRALASGFVEVSDEPIVGTVHYVILERANATARELFDLGDAYSFAAKLRVLHNATTGMRQLHNSAIAHQDVKLSNLLTFGDTTKVGDLGSAIRRNEAHPREGEFLAGDPTYAPFEAHYRHAQQDWNRRRLGCDLYLLGSTIAYLLTGTLVTQATNARLRDEYRWKRWGASYEEVLPFVKNAFGGVLTEFVQPYIPAGFSQVTTAIAQLCEPDPELRGWVLAGGQRRSHEQYGLQRLESRLNWLATQAKSSLP